MYLDRFSHKNSRKSSVSVTDIVGCFILVPYIVDVIPKEPNFCANLSEGFALFLLTFLLQWQKA